MGSVANLSSIPFFQNTSWTFLCITHHINVAARGECNITSAAAPTQHRLFYCSTVLLFYCSTVLLFFAIHCALGGGESDSRQVLSSRYGQAFDAHNGRSGRRFDNF